MYEYYSLLKQIHVSSAALSVSLFMLRGIWMMAWPHLLQIRAVRIVPHIVDTLLLASALLLAWQIAQYPFVHSWLTAKILALLLYIVLGSIALKRGPSKSMRILAWFLALATYAYIVTVAVTKQPIPFS